MIIAIDGPSGTGKSTVAKVLAKKINFIYFDTGAMYRAVCLGMDTLGITLKDEAALLTFLKDFTFKVKMIKGEPHYFIDDKEVTHEIRSPAITSKASEIAACSDIRERLVDIQRNFAEGGVNAVFEGRDMGTIVFPKADLKLYLDAKADIRAKRRYLEMKERGYDDLSEESIYNAILKRDYRDSTRKISPLKQAKDAIYIDTSNLSIQEVLDKILKHWEAIR